MQEDTIKNEIAGDLMGEAETEISETELSTEVLDIVPSTIVEGEK